MRISDWSSDVCSSDLTFDDDAPSATAEALQSLDEGTTLTGTFDLAAGADGARLTHVNGGEVSFNPDGWSGWIDLGDGELRVRADGSYAFRIEGERRVGTECVSKCRPRCAPHTL